VGVCRGHIIKGQVPAAENKAWVHKEENEWEMRAVSVRCPRGGDLEKRCMCAPLKLRFRILNTIHYKRFYIPLQIRWLRKLLIYFYALDEKRYEKRWEKG
jgi:hypothetical protein